MDNVVVLGIAPKASSTLSVDEGGKTWGRHFLFPSVPSVKSVVLLPACHGGSADLAGEFPMLRKNGMNHGWHGYFVPAPLRA